MKTKNILFIHGITSFGNSHFRLKHFLSTNGYVVHNPDLPGHGDNKMPLTDFEGMVKFVCDYIKTNIKNEPFILMGHSMGGGIAQIICNKFEKQISLLILECPLSAAIVNFSNNKQLKYDYENNIKPINISSDNNQLSNSSNVDSLAQ
jgi:alpha-beta hydrolase superfamily lysophospholipase